jgi:pimeloyl-ACP methyl ester carboxylesterase
MTQPSTVTVRSRDGTIIAFDRQGEGAPLIIVDGALCSRGMGPSGSLAALLKAHFTVVCYDRRGRGASTDSPPYSVKREVEDLEALIREVGGSAYLYGISSGAALSLEAAHRLPSITKLAVFEAPFFVDESRVPGTDYWQRIGAAVAAGRKGEAVKNFLALVGVPLPVILIMRLTPVWKKLKSSALTLPYDGALVQEFQRGKPLPKGRWPLRIPTLVLDGGKSPAWMRNANRSLAEVIPNARYQTLPGQTHMIKAAAHIPALVEFFAPSGSLATQIGGPSLTAR